MQTNSYRNILAKLLATTALTLVITGAPVTVDIDDAGMISLKPLVAMAKGGGDDDGDSDNSGSGSDSSGSFRKIQSVVRNIAAICDDILPAFPQYGGRPGRR